MSDVEEVLKYIASNEIKWVDLQFFDASGFMHRITLASKQIDEKTFEEGIQCADLSPVFGKSEQGALLLKPDPETMARLPWEPSTLRFICSVINASDERFLRDCRYAAERVETNLDALQIKGARVATEVEFFIFDAAAQDRTAPGRGVGTNIDTREAWWSASPLSAVKKGAFVAQPYDSFYAARTQISETLEENFGFSVDRHFHGRAPTAQQCMVLHEASVKTAADALSTLKFVVRNLANAVNGSSTFMPFPMRGEEGSTLSIMQSLWKGSSNMFFDSEDSYAQLSQTGRYYVGGLLDHAASLSLFCMPTTNSYHRASQKTVGWSANDSNALVRVSQTRKGEKDSKMISYGGADPSANPYLAYAAVLAAGIDGIKHKTEPGDALENLKENAKRSFKALPLSLFDALQLFDSDWKFIQGTIPKELVGEYLEMKLNEHKDSLRAVSAWEMEKYYNV